MHICFDTGQAVTKMQTQATRKAKTAKVFTLADKTGLAIICSQKRKNSSAHTVRTVHLRTLF
jgi:hypothetical protein